MAGPARAEESLQLEVFINEVPTQLIGAFVQLEDKRIASRQHELEEIGLNPKGRGEPDKLVTLDDLAGLSYRYDESTQRIYIKAPDDLRIAKAVSLACLRK